jgi:hypothetical protein
MKLEDILNKTDVPEDVKEEIRRNISEIEHNNNNNNNNNNRIFNDYLNNIINTTGDPLFVKDDNYRFVLVNDALCQMVGIKREDIIGKTLAESLPKYQMDHFLKVDKMVLDSGLENQCEEPLTGHDGKIKTIITKKTRYINEQGNKFLVGVIHDITERKQAEEKLRVSENKYKLLVENLNEGIWQIDKDSVTNFVNPIMANMLGYTVEEMMGKSLFDFMDEQGKKLAAENVKDRKKGVQEHHDFEFMNKNGTRVYTSLQTSPITDKEGNYLGALAGIQDITERKKAEKALGDSEERYRHLFEQAPFGVGIATLEGKILESNRKMQLITGYSAEELKGINLADTYANQNDREELLKTMKASGSVTDYSAVLRRKDGTEYHASLTISTVNIAGTTVLKTMMQDITERKKIQQEKEKLQEQLLQSQKMNAIGHLAGGIAHDFNNILGGVIGNADMALGDIKSGKYDPIKQERYLETIMSASQRAADLTQQILGFARKGKYNPQDLDVNVIIKEVSKLLSTGITPTGHSIEHILKSEKYINADATQMHQTIQNLAINARDAMKEGGKISITSEDVEIKNKVIGKLTTIPPNNYVKITVSDTGTGISEETLKHLFEPFYTTKEKGRGTGLGLSTTYGIIQNHNAYIDVKTQTGKGTKFYLYFPAVERKETRKEESESIVNGKGKILIVDDEVLIRDVAETVLSRAGYQITTAQEGNEALKLYKKEKYDLILSDSIMPNGMQGIELYQKIKEINPEARFCIMTGYQEEEKIQKMLKEGVKKVIPKPFRMQQLTEIINSVMKE